MARSRSGADDQKQILTVTLVLFILLSLLMGVVAYFGYADHGELQSKLKVAQALAKKRDEERRAILVEKVALKQMIGANFAGKEELGEFEGERNINKTKDKDGKDVLVFDAVTKPHKDVVWDAGQKLPTKTYLDVIRELRVQKERAEKAQKAADENAKATAQKHEQQVKALMEANDQMKKALQETTNALTKKFDELNKRYDDEMKKLIAAMPDFEAKEKKLKELEAERDKALGHVKRLVADAEAQRKKLEAKIQPVDVLKYDQPKGEIVRLDRTGQTVWLNLGSTDNVKPGLTFSVFGQGQYKSTAEAKGKVEVVQVLDRHLSMAKVTEVRNSARDPLLTADQLYNPVWTPGLREHVAIAGFIDLVGDGRDGTPDLVRMLEKQGVIVDIWFDLRDMTLKGANKDREEHVTQKTSYLVIGEQPELDVAIAKEGDKRNEGKEKINDIMAKLQIKAKENSVVIVPARRFLALMGLKAPKQNRDTDWTHYLLRQPKDGPAAMPGKKEEGKDDMPKKDEKKEDEK